MFVFLPVSRNKLDREISQSLENTRRDFEIQKQKIVQDQVCTVIVSKCIYPMCDGQGNLLTRTEFKRKAVTK